MSLATRRELLAKHRPWWWIFNPWLRALRMERAYANALEIIEEDGRELAARKDTP